MTKPAAIIPARYNGPPESGNGGYSCGVLASHIDGAARVRLHLPPPLDVPLRVETAQDGTVTLFDGDTLVGTAAPDTLDLEVPPAPTIEQARAAMQRFVGFKHHAFPTCFVCGPGREAHDGLDIFPGQVDDKPLLACVWEPGADLLDETGSVLEQIVWAALDCPGFFAATLDAWRPMLLGELLADIHAPVPGDCALVVYSWPLGSEGRKHYGGTAIADAKGTVLASARSTWIELRGA